MPSGSGTLGLASPRHCSSPETEMRVGLASFRHVLLIPKDIPGSYVIFFNELPAFPPPWLPGMHAPSGRLRHRAGSTTNSAKDPPFERPSVN